MKINLGNNTEMQVEEANLESETTLEVTLENYFKLLAKRIIGEMYWLIFGSFSVCAIAFLFFNGELPLTKTSILMKLRTTGQT